MITRIVKMTFRAEEVRPFMDLFLQNKEKIKGFPGCRHLELLQEDAAGLVFFTYSVWENSEALEAYRHSELFKVIWATTKAKFSEPAAAWSTRSRAILSGQTKA